MKQRGIISRLGSWTPTLDRSPLAAGKKRLVGSFKSAYCICNPGTFLCDIASPIQITDEYRCVFHHFFRKHNLPSQDD
tara:strand:- start:83 stop:316 length:234 start_codon:yes stop_codon:yes gene_type:complete